jgi:mannose-6-phosphate isomerase-like protein (cupin superfamily)
MLRFLPILISTSLFAPSLFAADPAGFALWKNTDLKAFDKSQDLADFRNHRTLMNHRVKNGEMEVHADWTDLFVVQSGEATILIGGTVVDAKTTGPGEIRGTTSTGGEKHKLVPGDIIHIPAGTPHQVLLDPGKTITYFAVKIPKAN